MDHVDRHVLAKWYH